MTLGVLRRCCDSGLFHPKASCLRGITLAWHGGNMDRHGMPPP
jgi:hypothetical protein